MYPTHQFTKQFGFYFYGVTFSGLIFVVVPLELLREQGIKDNFINVKAELCAYEDTFKQLTQADYA